MEQHYLSNGGELLLETRAQHLLTEDGRVIGASCSTADGTLNIYADVTLLATGGYGASVALRRQIRWARCSTARPLRPATASSWPKRSAR